MLLKELDLPLTMEEIVAATKSMQSNKAPGPDGFPVEFFLQILGQAIPDIAYIAVYKESLLQGSLPHTLTQTSISLLFKKSCHIKSC